MTGKLGGKKKRSRYSKIGAEEKPISSVEEKNQPVHQTINGGKSQKKK